MRPGRPIDAVSPRTKIRVGTAGWSIGSRYSTEIPADGSHLQRYGSVFCAVEIDSSFSKHHQMSTYARWSRSVDEDFQFAVKIPKALTHQGSLITETNEVLDRFFGEIEGLGTKLKVLLVQFPPRLGFNAKDARSFFRRLQSHVRPGVSIACEPRHVTWGTPAVNKTLEKLGVSRVAADPSRFEGDTRPGGDHRMAYFRMHGSPRIYFSDYEPQRLAALSSELEAAAQRTDAVWCIFDNTAHGHAIGNALAIQGALRQR